ncbi:cytochrome c biogenesis CcdA family protein [Leptolyngbya sp. BC1307]|uniref:cytochrome c biogenesis CcdA family protein n=1 Tax=Leptolyngbya sp. BC1307 TaxID=2029589 RepID=UPI000EFB1203|nr:cytochrome c biogenesis CcdA family protein [Leptolyngbya sp. BC1307]
MVTSSLSLGLALLGGLLTTFSPCILPVLPIIVGRSLQSHRYGPIALVLGLVSGFALTGSLLGITASWFTHLAGLLRTGAIILLLAVGLLTLFPQWRYYLQWRYPQWRYRLLSYLPIKRKYKKSDQEPKRIGLTGEFWLGTQIGLLWTPCAGPVLGSILVLAAVDHQVESAFLLLLLYGIGAAIPMLVFAYGGRYLSRRLLALRAHSRKLQRAGGAIVVSTAIAILLGWDVQIQLWLAPFFPALPL